MATGQREKNKIQDEELQDDETSPDEDDLDKQREDRRKEWGGQYDIWLIRAAKKNRMVEVCLVCEYPGITTDVNVFQGIPKRVDKYFVQFDVGGQEVWINKQFFLGCKPLLSIVSKPENDLLSAEN